MPYKSEAQERYFNANRGRLEAQGVDVNEWNQASKGMDLPRKLRSTGTPGGRAKRNLDKRKERQ